MMPNELLRGLHEYATRHPLPVCHGCPEGRFQVAIEQWIGLALLHLAQPITWSWFGGPGERGSMINVRDAGAVAEVVTVGDHLELVLMPWVSAEPVDVDRIGEILEKVTKLDNDLLDFRRQFIVRDSNTQGMVQRLIILTTHYATAPWLGSVWLPWFGYRRFELERTGVEKVQERR